MKRGRRKFSVAFKAKVALEAIKEKETLQQLFSKSGFIKIKLLNGNVSS